jgi:hypothetical protein
MGKINDLIGKKYGRWTVISLSPRKYRKMAMWKCRCECGTEREIIGNNLIRGISKSCGCLKVERTKATKTTHGDTKNGKLARLYTIWQGMKLRCEYPSQRMYPYYGGRGIKVCKEWHDYSIFKEWAIANGYEEGLSLDRKDNNADYCSKNCRWITQQEQVRHTSHNRFIEINGIKKCLTEWCEEYKITRQTVSSRICRGWNEIKAITTPAVVEQKL